LNGNNIDKKGAFALAEALKINSTLKELNLWNNNIDTEGGIALADALKSNSSLLNLNLKNNKLDDTGKEAFKNIKAAEL